MFRYGFSMFQQHDANPRILQDFRVENDAIYYDLFYKHANCLPIQGPLLTEMLHNLQTNVNPDYIT